MRMCQTHWDMLREEVKSQGLMPFVAKDGEIALQNVEADLNGAPEKDTFDPLMNANFAIWGNALDAGGLYLMSQKEDGTPYCPICESEAHNGYPAEWWITNAVNEQREKAKRLGLLKDQ